MNDRENRWIEIARVKLYPSDVNFLAAQTKEHNIHSKDGHEYEYKSNTDTSYRICKRCKSIDMRWAPSGREDWHPCVVTNFSTEQVDDWINNRSITIRKKKRRLVKVNGFYV